MIGHCICGEPAVMDDGRCDLCTREGCFGNENGGPDEWDGRTYPSRRKHRIGTTPDEWPAGWVALVACIAGTYEHVPLLPEPETNDGYRHRTARQRPPTWLDGNAA